MALSSDKTNVAVGHARSLLANRTKANSTPYVVNSEKIQFPHQQHQHRPPSLMLHPIRVVGSSLLPINWTLRPMTIILKAGKFALQKLVSVLFHLYELMLDGRKVLWESTTPTPRKRFCRQHLATLATPTILRPAPNFPMELFCKQSPVYGVFWPLLPHPSTDRNETRTWSSLSPYEPSQKFSTNPYTIVLVIVVTNRHTDKPTPVKTIPLSRG